MSLGRKKKKQQKLGLNMWKWILEMLEERGELSLFLRKQCFTFVLLSTFTVRDKYVSYCHSRGAQEDTVRLQGVPSPSLTLHPPQPLLQPAQETHSLRKTACTLCKWSCPSNRWSPEALLWLITHPDWKSGLSDPQIELCSQPSTLALSTVTQLLSLGLRCEYSVSF